MQLPPARAMSDRACVYMMTLQQDVFTTLTGVYLVLAESPWRFRHRIYYNMQLGLSRRTPLGRKDPDRAGCMHQKIDDNVRH